MSDQVFSDADCIQLRKGEDATEQSRVFIFKPNLLFFKKNVLLFFFLYPCNCLDCNFSLCFCCKTHTLGVFLYHVHMYDPCIPAVRHPRDFRICVSIDFKIFFTFLGVCGGGGGWGKHGQHLLNNFLGAWTKKKYWNKAFPVYFFVFVNQPW